MTDYMQIAAELAEARRIGVPVEAVVQLHLDRAEERRKDTNKRALVDYLLSQMDRFTRLEHMAVWLSRCQMWGWGAEDFFDTVLKSEGEIAGWACVWEAYALLLRREEAARAELVDRR